MLSIDKKTTEVLMKLFSLSFFAYCISFFGSIVLTKFYSPEEFGVYVSIFALITLAQPLSTLGYEGAIVVTKTVAESIKLACLCAIGIVVFVILGLFATSNPLVIMIGALYSLYVVLQSLANRQKKLFLLAMMRIQEVLGFFILAVMFSLYALTDALLNAVAINYGFICCVMAGLIFIGAKLPKNLELLDILKKHSKWPKFVLWSNFLNAAAGNVHIALFSVCFSAELAGLVAFAQKFTQLPYFLLGVIIVQILNTKIIECKTLEGRFVLYKRSLCYLVMLGSVVMICGLFLPKSMFDAFVPSVWRNSFDVMQILLLWGVGQLVGATVSVFYTHQLKLKLFLFLNCANFILTCLLFAVGSYAHISSQTFLLLLSFTKFAVYAVMALIPFLFLRKAEVNYQVCSFEQLNESQYRKLFAESINATPFHSYDWLYCIDNANPLYKLKIACAHRGAELVAAMPFCDHKSLPIFMVSGIYNTYGGWIYKKTSKAIKLKYPYKFFKRVELFDADGVKCGGDEAYGVTYLLNIQRPYEEILAAIHSKTRNQIKKAQKSALKIEQLSNNIGYIESCLRMYNNLKIKHNIASGFRESFLRTLLRRSCDSNSDIKTYIAVYDGNVVAYGVFLFSSSDIFYFMSGFQDEYSALNPINGILAAVIMEHCNKNIKNINFGAVPIGNAKLTHFKERWGAHAHVTAKIENVCWKTINNIRRLL